MSSEQSISNDKPSANVSDGIYMEPIPAGVPRRFPIGTMLGMLTLFAVLLGMLRMFGTSPGLMVFLALWVAVIAVSQALLFRGKRPRLASSLAGMGVVLAYESTTAGMEFFGNQWEPFEWSILSFAFVFMIFSLPFAALFGYLTGAGLAGVFLINNRIRTGHWNRTHPVGPLAEPIDPSRPSLLTERLWLRLFTHFESGKAQQLIAEAEVAATTTMLPQPCPDGWAQTWIGPQELNAREGRELVLAVFRRQDGQLLGAIRLQFSADQHVAELDGWIGRPFWNQGYATEAARAVIRYAFAWLPVQEIFARPLLRNPAAARVLVKLGLQAGEVLPQGLEKDGVGEDCQRYTISRSVEPSSTSPEPNTVPPV